jgi:hypothetical protein
MFKWLIRKRLDAFQKKYGYNVDYVRDILDADTAAALKLAKLQSALSYRRDVPLDVYYAVALVGTLHEDCGPCTQLNVTMALYAGVSPRVIAAVLEGTEARLGGDVELAVHFARATLAHDPAADELRDTIVARWGQRALVSLAFAIAAARVYPTIKYALGHGKTCQRVVVAGETIVPSHPGVAAPAAPALAQARASS